MVLLKTDTFYCLSYDVNINKKILESDKELEM